MIPHRRFSRRTFLRGLGAAVAVPLFDGMALEVAPAAQLAAEAVDGLAPKAGDAPRRLAFMFIPNGAHMPAWKPTGVGKDFDLPSILEPLADWRGSINILSGLAQDQARAGPEGGGEHARTTATFLTGVRPFLTAGKDLRAGVSVDQIAAQHLGHLTQLSSLELGCAPGPQAGECDTGYACAYSTNISWRTPSTPVVKEVNPAAVFDRLFGGGAREERRESESRRRHLRQSILDFVLEDARSLRGGLSANDRRKLDEYLHSVREVERRILAPPAKKEALSEEGKLVRPQEAVPDDFGEHMRLMGDLMVLAFQSDATRVCSFMVGNAGSNRGYQELKIGEGHHWLSHHGNSAEKQEKIRQINRYHVEQFAYILGKLSSVTEGDSTLLDNTMLVYGSGISDGDKHAHEDLPILLAGRGGGTIDTGRHIVYKDETPLMNLYVSLLNRAGVPIEAAGDSKGKLTELSI